MAAIYRKMYGRKLRLAFFIAIIVSLFAAFVTFAQGNEKTMTFSAILHQTQVKEIKAKDKPGHILLTSENKGLAIFENEELATYHVWVLWDGVENDSTFQGSGYGYIVMKFEDKSTIIWKLKGSNTVIHNEKTFSYQEKGTLEITNGTGRFKGIQGKGSYTGRAIDQDTEFPGYYNFSVTYTLP